jgi:hypothetical protein
MFQTIILLTVCFWTAPLEAQKNPNGKIPVGGLADAYLILIRDPLVQEELRVTDQQLRAITTLSDELDMTLSQLQGNVVALHFWTFG